MEKRFKVLRFIGSVYKILAIIKAVGVVLVAIGVLIASIVGGSTVSNLSKQFGQNYQYLNLFSGIVGGLIAFFVILIIGGLVALSLYAIGEAIYLFIALEENTRGTAVLIKRQLTSSSESQSANPMIYPQNH